VSVVTANNNDNFMAYFTSPLPPGFTVTATSTDQSLICGDTTEIRVLATNTVGESATGSQMQVTLPEGLRYVEGSANVGDPTTSVITADNLNVLTWNVGTWANGATQFLTLDAEFICGVLNSCLDPRVGGIEAEASGYVGGGFDQDFATLETINVEMALNGNNYVSNFDATWNDGLGLTEITFTVNGEDGLQMWSLASSNEPDGPRNQIELSTSQGATGGFQTYLTTQGDQITGWTYYYHLTSIYPNGCEVTVGPEVVTPYSATSSGVGGGLESNGRLASALARRAITHAEGWDPLRMPVQFRAKSGLDLLLPPVGPSDTRALDATPWDLPDVTNAVDVTSADYLDKDGERVATLLVIETEGERYEHNKPVCDRAGGSRILDVRADDYDDRGHKVVRTRLNHETRRTHEWSASVVAWESGKDAWTVWSGWHTDLSPEIPEGAKVYNIQAWSGKAGFDLALVESFLERLEGELTWSDAPFSEPGAFLTRAATLGGDLAYTLEGDLEGAELHAHVLLADGVTTEVHTLPVEAEHPLAPAALPPFLDVTLQVVKDGVVTDNLWLSDGTWAPYDDGMWGGDSRSDAFAMTPCAGDRATLTDDLQAPALSLAGCATTDVTVSEYAGVARHIGGALAPLDLTEHNTLTAWVDSDASFQLCAVDIDGARVCTTHEATPGGGWAALDLATAKEAGELNALSVVLVFTEEPGAHTLTAGDVGLHAPTLPAAPGLDDSAASGLPSLGASLTTREGTAGCGCSGAPGAPTGLLLLLPLLGLRRRD
jgi:hypothetical protein